MLRRKLQDCLGQMLLKFGRYKSLSLYNLFLLLDHLLLKGLLVFGQKLALLLQFLLALVV